MREKKKRSCTLGCRHGDINDIIRGLVDGLLYKYLSSLPGRSDAISRQVQRGVGRVRLADVTRRTLENDRFRSGLQLPVRASALTRTHSWHFCKTLVQRQVVSDGILPVARFHFVERVASANSRVDLREGQHAVGRVDQRLGDQLGVGHARFLFGIVA